MLKIFVLEDEWIQQSRIEAVLQDLIRQKSLQCKAPEVFGKSSQLLDAITERGAHHLFFLDIEIKGEEKKGLEIAKEIRKKDPHATIVFVTTHSEFMPITFQYKVAALDLSIKRWARKSSERESAQPSIIPWSKLGPRLRKMPLHLRVRWRVYKFLLIRFCMLKRPQPFTRSFYTPRMSAWNFTLVLPISKKQIPACIGATAPLW